MRLVLSTQHSAHVHAMPSFVVVDSVGPFRSLYYSSARSRSSPLAVQARSDMETGSLLGDRTDRDTHAHLHRANPPCSFQPTEATVLVGAYRHTAYLSRLPRSWLLICSAAVFRITVLWAGWSARRQRPMQTFATTPRMRARLDHHRSMQREGPRAPFVRAIAMAWPSLAPPPATPPVSSCVCTLQGKECICGSIASSL